MLKRSIYGFAVVIMALAIAGCGAKKEKPFQLTVVPYEAADKLSEEYKPMATYLAKRVGAKTGAFHFVVDYAGVVAALQGGQVDVAYLSSFPYALATNDMKLHPLAMPVINGSELYHGVLFVRADSPIKSIADIKGRKVAFGDPTSTTGYLLPRALLESKGIRVEKPGDLKDWYNAGDANSVVAAVENGTADVGCAYDMVFQVAYRDHPEKAKGMRIIAQTESIPNGIYVARPDMPADQVKKLRKAFLDMNTDPEGRAAMLKAPNDKMLAADDNAFNGVREKAKILHLNLQSLEKKKN